MKTGKRSQGRWRKSGKRGVSPIIATILLVAITVVLAAVLYVLISGLTRGPGNTPLGSAIAVSQANDGTCRTYCNYTFTIESASSGVTANGLKFQVQTSGGVITAYSSVRLIDVSNCAVGYYTTAGWTAGAPAAPNNVPAACAGGTPGLASQVSSGDQIILTTTASLAAGGNSLILVGTGSYSGTVGAAIP